jgi:flavin-dependent dehydrogenase
MGEVHRSKDDFPSLLILGGGPAGASAAITARQAGLRVVVLERSRFPRDRPGDTLHPGIEPLLRSLGAWEGIESAGYIRHEGIWQSDGSGASRRFEPYGRNDSGPWSGLQVPRRDLDTQLLQAARRLGAEVRFGMTAEDVIVSEGRVRGVTTPQGPIHARFTLDSTGGGHRLARRLGIVVRNYSTPLVARYGYVTGSSPALDHAPEFRVEPGGWTWMARVGQGRYHWTRLAIAEHARSLGPPDEYAVLSPEGPPRAENVTWRCADHLAGDGFFLSGDAAVVLDPATSRGVLRAIMTGTQAAHLASAVISGRVPGPEAATWYDGWLRNWFHRDLVALRERYRIMFPGIVFPEDREAADLSIETSLP